VTDWLLLLKLSLGGVLLFDLLILQRKPAADAIVQRLDWQAELARKGAYGWLMPTAALLVLLLDRAQGNDPRPALALLALVVAYLALPRSLALEREHLLLDGWRIPLARVLSACSRSSRWKTASRSRSSASVGSPSSICRPERSLMRCRNGWRNGPGGSRSATGHWPGSVLYLSTGSTLKPCLPRLWLRPCRPLFAMPPVPRGRTRCLGSRRRCRVAPLVQGCW